MSVKEESPGSIKPINKGGDDTGEDIKVKEKDNSEVDEKIVSTEDFSKDIKDGKEYFFCYVCGYEGAQVGNVKKHIALKHLQKPGSRKRRPTTEADGSNVKKSKQEEPEIDESLISGWLDGKFVSSTQNMEEDPDKVLAMFDDEGNALCSDETLNDLAKTVDMSEDLENTVVHKPKPNDQAVEDLEEQLKEKNKIIEKLRKDFETTDELYVTAMGKVSDLELEVTEKNKKIDKFSKITNILQTENRKLKAETKESVSEKDLKQQIKEAKNETKEKAKEVAEMTKRLAELTAKVSDEVTARAKAEAELARTDKLCGYLQESLNKVQQNGKEKKVEKSDKVCHNMEKEGKCKYKENCRYIHPDKMCEYFVKVGKCPLGEDCKDLHSKIDREAYSNSGKNAGARERGSKDCKWWLMGDCRYPGGNECSRGLHKMDKFATIKQDHFLDKSQGEVWRDKKVRDQSGIGMPTTSMNMMLPNQMMGVNSIPAQMMGTNQMPAGMVMMMPMGQFGSTVSWNGQGAGRN